MADLAIVPIAEHGLIPETIPKLRLRLPHAQRADTLALQGGLLLGQAVEGAEAPD
jgi:hypothetical protein